MKDSYTPPSTAELRALLRRNGWTGKDAALRTGVDPRTVRRWTGGEVSIPYAAWVLLQVDSPPPLPETGVFVWQDGDDAWVAYVQTWWDDEGKCDRRHIYHAQIHRFGAYWREYNPRTGEWTQLFGFYGGHGPAMMQTKLPGHHVAAKENLPPELPVLKINDYHHLRKW